jgi:hypothetical protein
VKRKAEKNKNAVKLGSKSVMPKRKGGSRKKRGLRTFDQLLATAVKHGHKRAKAIQHYRNKLSKKQYRAAKASKIARMKRWCEGPGQHIDHRGEFT